MVAVMSAVTSANYLQNEKLEGNGGRLADDAPGVKPEGFRI